MERVARLAGCSEDVAGSCLRRLRGRMLVEDDGYTDTRALERSPGSLYMRINHCTRPV